MKLISKINFLVILLIFIYFTLVSVASAATYYVSSSGNDSNNGTSISTPWKTLIKVNSTNFLPGDNIYFKRGDSFDGTLNITSSGTSTNRITYGAYGSGDKPKIYGSVPITGWTQYSGNIYKATVANDITQLFIDGERALLARYPDTGYFNVTTVNANQFSSTDLNNTTNYTGAIWNGRNTRFTFTSYDVISSNGQSLTLSQTPYLDLAPNSGFFLTNKLEFLNQPGEWYYNVATKTIYFWTPNGSSPSNYNVRGSTFDYGVHVDTKTYITIKDLEVAQASLFGIYLDNDSDYAVVDNNDVINPGVAGIVSFWWSSDSQITNNYIHEANNIGIYLYNNPGAMVTDNEVIGTGKLKNIARRVTSKKIDNIDLVSWGVGIESSIGDMTFMYNRIIDSGYIGIGFNQQAALIKYNYVNGACQVLDDGGGIYTYTGTEDDYNNTPGASGSVIEDNIVLNVFGTPIGVGDNEHFAGFGIYMDNATKNVLIQRNTVSGASGGIFFNPGGLITFKNNTVMNAGLLMYIAGEYEDNTITNNIYYATARPNYFFWWGPDSHQRIIHIEDNTSSIFNFNKYFAHYNTTDVFVNKSGFSQWKLDTGQDASSTFDGTPFTSGEIEKLFYNDTKTTKTFYANNAIAKDIYGTSITSFTLEPFTSKIIVGSNLNNITEINENIIPTPDTTKPTISVFTIPTTSTSLTVPINTLTATDNIGVTGYLLTETSTAPSPASGSWLSTPQANYTFTTQGTKILYAWVKDDAGNVSTGLNDQVIITLPVVDITPPTISSISASDITSSSAVITWNTNENSNSQVEYGTTSNYGFSSIINQTQTLSHTTTLSGLRRGVTYHYLVKSIDGSSNIAVSTDKTFITTQRLVKTPKIRSLSATKGSIKLSWLTPVDEDSQNYELYRGVIIMKSKEGYINKVNIGTALADIKAPTLNYQDHNVVNGTKYYYTVFAYDDILNYSDPEYISFTPSAIGGGSSSSSSTLSSSSGNSSPVIASITQEPIQSKATISLTQRLYRGIKGQEVISLQTILKQKGYYTGIIDGSFGPMTEKSVKTFQLSNNLIPDGIIGTKSREILNQEKISTTIYQQTQSIAKTYTLTKKLSFRSPLNDSEEVKLLQQILITKGYLLDTNIDGLFGPKVLQSVISFQRANNLSPDGVVGIQTREYLNK